MRVTCSIVSPKPYSSRSLIHPSTWFKDVVYECNVPLVIGSAMLIVSSPIFALSNPPLRYCSEVRYLSKPSSKVLSMRMCVLLVFCFLIASMRCTTVPGVTSVEEPKSLSVDACKASTSDTLASVVGSDQYAANKSSSLSSSSLRFTDGASIGSGVVPPPIFGSAASVGRFPPMLQPGTIPVARLGFTLIPLVVLNLLNVVLIKTTGQ